MAAHAMQLGNPARSIAAIEQCIATMPEELAAQATVSDSTLIATGNASAMFARIPLIEAQRERFRYTLVGHVVPVPIDVPYWVNAPNGTTHADMSAPVTLVEFAAPSRYGPQCEQMHPAVRRLLTRYRNRGFRVLVVAYLDRRNAQGDTLSVAQELDADRVYWAAQLGETVPVAVTTFSDEHGTHLIPKPTLYRAYGVNDTPTFFLVDQRGVIRDVLEGVDTNLETRLAASIERILR